KQLTTHLHKHKIKFEIVPHKTVYTAYDLAQTLGEKLGNIAKTLLLKIEFPKLQKKHPGYYILAIPASYQADFKKIKKALKAARVGLAPERVITRLGLAAGAVTPFGSLHKVELLLDRSLANLKEVLVRAGSHTESIRMKVRDLHRLEAPRVSSFGSRARRK
ncbi:YbaK/EbsC family protein, partial [Candidatus Uhrbacteria bacterium]|nr:YbaK/EbsC family protein [Candidatus Uhrbacteria bacterium]